MKTHAGKFFRNLLKLALLLWAARLAYFGEWDQGTFLLVLILVCTDAYGSDR